MKIKIRGQETLGTGPWGQSLQNHQTAQSSRIFFFFLQRKPKIESRQKSKGPPRWFDSSLFGGELSIAGPSLRVLGRRPQDSFPLPVKQFLKLGYASAATASSSSRCFPKQASISSSRRTVGLPCARPVWIRAAAVEKGQLGGPIPRELVAEPFIQFSVE